MAVAAYASVLSLLNALDNVLLPSRRWMIPDMSQIETLQQKLRFLQEFLELHSSNTTRSKEVLHDLAIKMQIRGVAEELDDLIDNYVVDRLRTAGCEDQIGKSLSSSFYQDLQVLIQKIESINRELTIFDDKDHGKAARLHRNSSRGGSTTGDNSSGNHTTVGLEDHVVKIMDRLTGNEPSLQIIPIVGMGGIGKTTLARNIFDNKLIVEHFEERIWITISQEYDVQKILLGLGSDGTSLYQKLFGRRYLIVMDDVWSINAWDDVKSFFPNNGKRSRIMMTTRLSSVADSLGAHHKYSMGFLDEENSWKLFSEKAFYNGGRTSELEEIGKKIANKCGGLPLTLVVIGGLLASSNLTRDYWESVADDMNSLYDLEIDENCLRILYLSYDHLPIHLKKCFLFLKDFPEDHTFEVSMLIEWWVSEGIVKPTRNKDLEEVAMEYLEDLIGRNMILIRKLGKCGNIKTFGMHDLLRQLCIKESLKEHIFSIPNMQCVTIDEVEICGNEDSCFICCDNTNTRKRISLREVLNCSTSTALMSLMVCDRCNPKFPRLNESRFIRLINKVNGRIVEIPHSTKLRGLLISIHDYWGEFGLELASPPTISLLWNLQGLYIGEFDHGTLLLSKIWEMPQLRHVHLERHELPDPTNTTDFVVLQHLQTLDSVQNLRCTEEVVRRIPNLVKLKVFYSFNDSYYYCLNNLALLHKLQSLTLSFGDVNSLDIEGITFPRSLKKLVLTCCGLGWKDMTMIGSLPNLQVLKLCNKAFKGDEWCTVEGQFRQLKYLRLELLDVVTWRAESSHFPALETLHLAKLHSLEEFPLGIGDADTLRKICVANCNESVVDSVMQVKEEQENYGNELLLQLSDDQFSY